MKKHPTHKQEKLAIFAFAVTLILAISAFYYIYNQQVQYGKTVEGLQKYFEAQWRREHPGEPVPIVTFEQPETVGCCCQLPSGGRFSKFGIQEVLPKSADESIRVSICQDACAERGATFLAVQASNKRCT